jgi:hypothetical protein
MLLLIVVGKNLSLPLLGSTCQHHLPWVACSNLCLPLCLFIRTSVIGFRACLNQGWVPLEDPKFRAFIEIRSPSQTPGVNVLTYLVDKSLFKSLRREMKVFMWKSDLQRTREECSRKKREQPGQRPWSKKELCVSAELKGYKWSWDQGREKGTWVDLEDLGRRAWITED